MDRVERRGELSVSNRIRRVFGALLAVVAAGSVQAQVRTWNSDYGLWSEAAKWTPNGVPGPGAQAFIGTIPAAESAFVSLNQNATVGALTIGGMAELITDGRRLHVTGATELEGTSPWELTEYYATLEVENGAAAADFETISLQLGDRSSLQVRDNATALVHGDLASFGDGVILGNGQVTVLGTLSNGGRLSPVGNLTINVPAGSIDLDGAGAGELYLNAGGGNTLSIIAAAVSDPFDGELFIGNGETLAVEIPGGWATGPATVIRACHPFSGNGNTSYLEGSELTIGGALEIGSSYNTLQLNADTVFTSTASFTSGVGNHLQVPANTVIEGGAFQLDEDAQVAFEGTATIEGGDFVLGQDASVRFAGPTSVKGGTFATPSASTTDGDIKFQGPTNWEGVVTIAGAARQLGAATVSAPTTINALTLDLDGSGATAWQINSGLVLNAQSIEAGAGDVFDGVINVPGLALLARLTVNLADPGASWTLGGELNLGGNPSFFNTRIAGSPLVITGTVHAGAGRAQISAATTVAAGGALALETGASLRMNGATTIAAGASISGPGTLQVGPAGTLLLEDGVALGSAGLTNEGDLEIGAGPGVAAVNRFTQPAAGTWAVEIGGPVTGTESDLLLVDGGPAQLGGELHVSQLDLGQGTFLPELADEFTILTAVGGVNGTFANSPESHAYGYTYVWQVVYGSHDVRLRLVEITPTLGDLNCDGAVDFADINLFVLALTNPDQYVALHPECRWMNADVNGDGTVDFGDINPFVQLVSA